MAIVQLIGPAAAWPLHDRCFDRAALVSAGLGLVISVTVVGAGLVLAQLAGAAVGRGGGAAFAFPVALPALAGAVLRALIVGPDYASNGSTLKSPRDPGAEAVAPRRRSPVMAAQSSQWAS